MIQRIIPSLSGAVAGLFLRDFLNRSSSLSLILLPLICTLLFNIIWLYYSLIIIKKGVTGLKKDALTLLLEMIEICFYFNLTVFYMIFECILPCFAEIAKFADKEFYRDWWNATSYNEFLQKNNRPVDDFSRKYIREPLIEKYKFSESIADFLCFAFSAITHEFVIIIVYQAFTPFILVLLIV